MTRAFVRVFVAGVLAFGLAVAAAGPAAAQSAVLRGLDKVTGHARDFRAPIGQSVTFGSLEVVARSCQKRPAEEAPEVAVYLQVFESARSSAEGQEPERRQLFSGWIFASSPGLNAIEHPVYDIWAIDCRS